MREALPATDKKKTRLLRCGAMMTMTTTRTDDASPSPSLPQRYSYQYYHVRVLVYYFLFGLLHELAHYLTAAVLYSYSHHQNEEQEQEGAFVRLYDALLFFFFFTGGENSIKDDATMTQRLFTGAAFWIRALMGRCMHLPMATNEKHTAVIRHAGWIFSVALTTLIHLWIKRKQQRRQVKNNPRSRCWSAIPTCTNACRYHQIQIAALLCAVDALATDLFGFGGGGGGGLSPGTAAAGATYFCGNFGLIMVSPAWATTRDDHGQTALQVLRKLVQVTMVRGAQAGGVVCWTSSSASADNDDNPKSPVYRGIRSRIVNMKRADLSKGIYKSVKRNATTFTGNLKPGIRGFFGHTRFATSCTNATLEGTHPHQWSKPTIWTVYEEHMMDTTKPRPSKVRVENFVTHNGDFDFFRADKNFHELKAVQQWLVKATGYPMPTSVDSAAIAGVIDILRTKGSFGLSLRYAILVGRRGSDVDPEIEAPSHAEYQALARIFEASLHEVCKEENVTIHDISERPWLRSELTSKASARIPAAIEKLDMLSTLICKNHDEHETMSPNQVSPLELARVTVDAFLDNDLFHASSIFLDNAKGSFGLMSTSSLDADRQICIAARGQSMSVALYPRKGLICYGSEPAATKAGLSFETPGGDLPVKSTNNDSIMDGDLAFRIDLDDLGGEICLIDWGKTASPNMISFPHRNLKQHVTMFGRATLILSPQNNAIDLPLMERTMMLEENEAIQPLPPDSLDPILRSIRDIPRICLNIQDTWNATSLNRLSSCHLVRCLRSRLEGRASGRIPSHAGTIDILLTGCEVSLWVAEQFATDLQKCFPKLYVKAVSSNKVLGVFGQEMTTPAVGHGISEHTYDLSNTIVIIVSHSGGTFAPLACSNLLQSKTQNIFVITRERDTQIGKQLRSMSHGIMAVINNRVFSTSTGLRPAEASSISVAAQHQVLTQILVDVATAILDNPDFVRVSGAVITEDDIRTLIRCDHDNIAALEAITGTDREGKRLPKDNLGPEKELREAGRLWSDHVLENARAFIITFVYIMVTVTVGYPIVTGFAVAVGMDMGKYLYITRFFDALVYFFLPQINVIILRIIQNRDLRHRMAGRTVIIGDIPWVAQAADAFLSKIFACSYSIAGVNVLHGNPTDHLVHRHTHRVVRGSLLVCGRPDGRLMALTSAEAATCLSINQTSSIQSFGGTCETITIGHNPSKMSLAKRDIFLPSSRPRFLCEQMLMEEAGKDIAKCNTSPNSLLGVFMNWKNNAVWEQNTNDQGNESLRRLTVDAMICDRGRHRRIVNSISLSDLAEQMDGESGKGVGLRSFLKAYASRNRRGLAIADIVQALKSVDRSRHGTIYFADFAREIERQEYMASRKEEKSLRGSTSENSSAELYIGHSKRAADAVADYILADSQRLSSELYESRCASLQRFVAMTVMFHELGSRVQAFFPAVSAGLLGYRMDRTHSIMRVATTASPVSGADVRERMERLQQMHVIEDAVRIISAAWSRYRTRKTNEFFKRRSKLNLLAMRNSLKDSLGSSISSALDFITTASNETKVSESYVDKSLSSL